MTARHSRRLEVNATVNPKKGQKMETLIKKTSERIALALLRIANPEWPGFRWYLQMKAEWLPIWRQVATNKANYQFPL